MGSFRASAAHDPVTISQGAQYGRLPRRFDLVARTDSQVAQRRQPVTVPPTSSITLWPADE